MNIKVRILGKRVYSPNLRDLPVLESLQSSFIPIVPLPAIWREKNYRQIHRKLKRGLTFRSTAESLKLGQYNLLSIRIYFQRKLFAVRFPYKHRKFGRKWRIHCSGRQVLTNGKRLKLASWFLESIFLHYYQHNPTLVALNYIFYDESVPQRPRLFFSLWVLRVRVCVWFSKHNMFAAF